MTRTCDAIGCQAKVATGRFMCTRHWRLVPPELQRSITGRYRLLRRDFAFLSDVAYLDACVKAIDRLAAADGKQGRNPYQGLLNAAVKRNAAEKGTQ